MAQHIQKKEENIHWSVCQVTSENVNKAFTVCDKPMEKRLNLRDQRWQLIFKKHTKNKQNSHSNDHCFETKSQRNLWSHYPGSRKPSLVLAHTFHKAMQHEECESCRWSGGCGRILNMSARCCTGKGLCGRAGFPCWWDWHICQVRAVFVDTNAVTRSSQEPNPLFPLGVQC